MEARDLSIAVNVAANRASEIASLALEHGIDVGVAVGLWDDAFQAINTQLLAAQLEATAIADVSTAFAGTTVAAPASTVAAAGGFQVQLPPAPSNVAGSGATVLPFTGAAAQVAQAPGFTSPTAPGFAPASAAPLTLEQLWNAFFTDAQNGTLTQNWHDNRNDKKTAGSPDFKSKSIPQPGKPEFKVGLWKDDSSARTKNPSWVPAALQQFGL